MSMFKIVNYYFKLEGMWKGSPACWRTPGRRWCACAKLFISKQSSSLASQDCLCI